MGDTTAPKPVLTTFERNNDRLVSVVKVGLRPRRPRQGSEEGMLPVEYQVITRDIADIAGPSDLTGFQITQVYPGSSAAQAGCR